MKKALVTGGAGFIGSNLVDKLIEQGVEVVVLDNLSTGKKDNINPNATFYQIDINNNLENIDFAFEGVDVVFHLAAKTTVQESLSEPMHYHQVNTSGTLNILEACVRNKIKKFIFSSSSSVYGNCKVPTGENTDLNPISQYALTKQIGEEYCKLYDRLYDIDICILRYFNVFGDRMNNDGGYKLVFPIFKELLKSNNPLTINNDGNQKRDFIHVNDICNVNILCANWKEDLNAEIFNVGSGINYSINEIADMFGGEKQYGNIVTEPTETLADISKIDLDLDWKPKGILKNWIKKYKE
jgi:UDP-glucose 4-epimerase